MRYSSWVDGSYPVYVNPTFKEILELNAQRWDTLRICTDEGDILLWLQVTETRMSQRFKSFAKQET